MLPARILARRETGGRVELLFLEALGQQRLPFQPSGVEGRLFAEEIMHAVLRRKARCEAAGEEPGTVSTNDLVEEVQRFSRAADRLAVPTGNYV